MEQKEPKAMSGLCGTHRFLLVQHDHTVLASKREVDGTFHTILAQENQRSEEQWNLQETPPGSGTYLITNLSSQYALRPKGGLNDDPILQDPPDPSKPEQRWRIERGPDSHAYKIIPFQYSNMVIESPNANSPKLGQDAKLHIWVNGKNQQWYIIE